MGSPKIRVRKSKLLAFACATKRKRMNEANKNAVIGKPARTDLEAGAPERLDDTIVTAVYPHEDEAQPSTAVKDACLIVIYGDDLGRKFNIVGTELRIGRSDCNDICVPQESVSREHAVVSCDSDGVFLSDNGSTNGTFVNDARIGTIALRDGDFVKIGRSIFKFLSGDNIERSYHEEIFRLSTSDGLTQIYNRRYFEENLERELTRARRYGRPLALVLFDLDNFKGTNDKFGHRAGDFVLRQVAKLAAKRARSVDVVARFGGEEFAVILPEIDAQGAEHFAEDLRKLVDERVFEFERDTIPTQISVGVAVLHEGIKSGDDLVKEADRCLLAAKAQGRNRVVLAQDEATST